MQINEIFYSIQGESSFAGFPCIFIRMAGCNLRCLYCDTAYAYEAGVERTLPDVLNEVARFQCDLVEVTGGEPMVQHETPFLISELLNGGYQVLLETNGSIDLSSLDQRCHRIIDVKLPSSGEHRLNYMQNYHSLHEGDELKFVVGNREDYLYARQVLDVFHQEILRRIIVNFSPLYKMMEPRLLASWILEDGLSVRLNLQIHKIIWPADMKGV